MIANLIDWSIHNKFFVVVMSIIVIILGIANLQDMSIDILPEFSPPQVVVQTEAKGLTATEVESLVSLPLESVLNGTEGVSMVKSLSMNGISSITIIFKQNMDIYHCRQLVMEKLQIVQGKLPPKTSTPTMLPVMSVMGDILKIGLISHSISPMELRTLCDWEIKNRIASVPGIARVLVMGGQAKQFQVVVNSLSLRNYDLSLDQVLTAIDQSNTILPGGYLSTADQTYTINAKTKVTNLSDIENTVVATYNNIPVLLKDLAQIKIGSDFKIGDAIIDGEPGIEITITKQPKVDTIKITKEVESAIAELKPILPKDIQIITLFRQSDFIQTSINNVLLALGIGGILVAVVVSLFLANWRMTIISLTAIPLSLFSATLIIRLFGGTLNTMTLGGLAIAVGEVVDDALVDVENIYKKLKQNESALQPKDSSLVIKEACKEVRSSVVFATLIVSTVFIPVFTLGGVEGKIFTPLGLSYILATLSSLMVALFVTPALSMYLLGSYVFSNAHETRLINFVKNTYSKILNITFRHENIVILASVLLFFCALCLIPFMGQSFLPEFKEPSLIIGATSLPGQSLEATTRIGAIIEDKLLSKKLVSSISQRAGRAELDDDSAGPYYSEFDCKISNSKDWSNTVAKIRHILNNIPGCVFDIGSFIQHRMDDVLSGGTKADIAIKLFGPDLNVLRQKGQEIANVLKSVKGAIDVRPETQVLVPEIVITLNRYEASRYGISAQAFANNVQVAFSGYIVSNVLENQKQFPLRVLLDEDARHSIESIRKIFIDTPTGIRIPLSSIAKVEIKDSPNVIVREHVARRIVIQANCAGRDIVSIVDEAKEKIKNNVKLPANYYIDYSGQYKARIEAAQTLFLSSILSLILVVVLLRQGLPNWLSTILVLFNLPLSTIGGIIAVSLTGNELSIGSLIGFISLFGISTRNSLLLVSKIDKLNESGHNLDESIKIGCLERVTPILMTASTAALGMLPLAIWGGSGRELEHPLAIVIVGGLISSTLLVLIVIPALFKFFHRKKSQTVKTIV